MELEQILPRKVGYRCNGTECVARRGRPAVVERLVLGPEDFIRGDDPVMFDGGEALRSFLHLKADR